MKPFNPHPSASNWLLGLRRAYNRRQPDNNPFVRIERIAVEPTKENASAVGTAEAVADEAGLADIKPSTSQRSPDNTVAITSEAKTGADSANDSVLRAEGPQSAQPEYLDDVVEVDWSEVSLEIKVRSCVSVQALLAGLRPDCMGCSRFKQYTILCAGICMIRIASDVISSMRTTRHGCVAQKEKRGSSHYRS